MQDPYAKPAAAVSDPPEPQHAFPKPAQVRTAIVLLWVTFALAFPMMAFEFDKLSGAGEIAFLGAFTGAMLALAAFLNVKISEGRNWARWVYLAITILGLVSYAFPDATKSMSVVEVALAVASFVLTGATLYLIFTKPGALWFGPRG
jgi:protein-S-isoprenylcysteine O-methyltransferase Ste14